MLGGLAGGRVGSGCGLDGPTGGFWRIARRCLFFKRVPCRGAVRAVLTAATPHHKSRAA